MYRRVWVFWEGWGWLVPAITLGSLVVAQLVTEAIAGPDSYSENRVAQTLGVAFATAALWLAGHAFEVRRRRLAAAAGEPEPPSPGRADSFYYIPMKVWAYIFAGLHVLMRWWL